MSGGDCQMQGQIAMDQIESTGEKLTEGERVEVGIAECRRQIKRWQDRLHLLQSVRNQAKGVTFEQRVNKNGNLAWYVLFGGKVVCRDYGYSRLGTAMGAATRIKAIVG
jgi:hypothetical protein